MDSSGHYLGHRHPEPHDSLPVHVTEKLNRIKRVQQEIASNEGRVASIADLARE